MSESVVERAVAEAMWIARENEVCARFGEDHRQPFPAEPASEIWRMARAAISAHEQALKKAGFVIVEREATNEMLHAAAKAMSPGRRPTPERVSVKQKHAIRYRAMIDCSLRTRSSEG